MKHEELKYACREAREWAERFDSLEEAWLVCERGDWMIWWLNSVLPDGGREDKRHQIACDCAEHALRLIPGGENRPRRAIETKRRWCAGEATDDELRESRCAAAAAAAAYAAAAAAYAYAAAVAAAADAAYAAAAADAADAAAAYAAYAAAADAADAAILSERKAQADIVRKYFPEFPRR